MSTIRCKKCGKRIKLQDLNEHKRSHTAEELVYNSIENELKLLTRLYTKKSKREQKMYKQGVKKHKYSK